MKHYIDRSICICCGTCDVECPFHAIIISPEGKFWFAAGNCREGT